MPDVLAIIPARGGSKGVPRKNVLPLAGKPLIGWTIDAAQAARHVDRVIVSTDDAEITEISRQHGADVVERPTEISGDTATSEAALIHTLEVLRDREGYVPEITIFLQCTSPLTVPEDIDGTVNAMLEQNADSALAVADFHYFLWKRTGDNAVGINHDKSLRLLRQQREPEYIETGSVYVMRTSGFLESRHRFFGQTAMWVIPPHRRCEIDDPDDCVVAETKLRIAHRNGSIKFLPQKPRALVLDFDGVMTDNRVIVLEDGREAVLCDRGDGMGVAQVVRAGVHVIVISKERNSVVTARCKKLGIECMQGIDNKSVELWRWLERHKIRPADTIYVGNDINDIECMQAVGCGVAVSDAHGTAKSCATVLLESSGGFGAVRELTDMILERLKKGESS